MIIDKSRILVVEFSQTLGTTLIPTLEEAGFNVINANNRTEGPHNFYANYPDLVIMVEDMLPLTVQYMCSRMRQVSSIPIIVLGTSQGEKYLPHMLEAGADAYMTTSASTNMLIARIHSLLRRSKKECLNSNNINLISRPAEFIANRLDNTSDSTPTIFGCISRLTLKEVEFLSYRETMSDFLGDTQDGLGSFEFCMSYLMNKLGRIKSDTGSKVDQWRDKYPFYKDM